MIGKYLRAGVMINGRLEATRKGVPQGGPLSPLLANIILDDLDKELEQRGHRFARYADDFVILVRVKEGQRSYGDRLFYRSAFSTDLLAHRKNSQLRIKLKYNVASKKTHPPTYEVKRCQLV